jgi:ElaB/YqjD/DUF883 family membrane-anchored ribosome-binding protein
MAMERVTVEQNGERFTLEVPEGTSDDQIKSFLSQQQGGSASNLTTPPADVSQNVSAQAPAIASGAARELIGGEATASARNALEVAKNATQWTPNAIMEVVSHPVQTAQAFVSGHPWANTPVKTLAGGIGKNVAGSLAQGLVSPENLMTLPYNMAAYEQDKIRANPTAPGLENNPFAQQVRGEFATQGQAAAANRRQAIGGQQYGGVTAEEQAILQADRQRQIAQQQKQAQARQILQQPPTAANYMQRMKAMTDLYGNVGQ